MSNEQDVEDLRQIGLTPEAKVHLESVMQSGWFEDRQAAYRTSIAFALANDLIATAEQVRGAVTAYNFIGGIDRDGRLRSLIGLFLPLEARTPARTAERLAHAGLPVLAERLAGGERLLSEALGFEAPASPSRNGEP